MKRLGSRVVVVLAVLLLLVAAMRTTHVTGSVINIREQPLEGIRIIAVRNGNIIAETRTTADGKYDFVVACEKPFDLMFRDGAYETLIVKNLIPGEEQRIASRLNRWNEILNVYTR